MKTLRFLATLLLAPMAANAEAPAELTWDDLIDPATQSYEDPYRDLTAPQMQDVLQLVRVRMQLDGQSIQDSALETELEALERGLTDDGIDVDWLLDQRMAVAKRRELAATSGNTAIDGEDVTLMGFAIAAPSENGKSVVYLVPERGMCSHIPPPNPNQMVKVVLEEAWVPNYIYEPVQITGKLSIAPNNQVMRVVDGPVAMNATYALSAERASAFTKIRPALSAQNPDPLGHLLGSPTANPTKSVASN